MKICEYCGTPRQDGETRCPSCGAYYPVAETAAPAVPVPPAPDPFQAAPDSSASAKNAASAKKTSGDFNALSDAILTLVITVCFGWLGVHRFMKGKIATGILWACTLGLFVVGYVVDMIIAAYRLVHEIIACLLAKAR